MGLFDSTKELAESYVEQRARRFQDTGTPNTRVDSGGTREQHGFRGQSIDRAELRDVKEMRESGGVVSHLVHAKALMEFGTGATFESEQEEVAEFLHDEFNDLDNLLIDLGEDALWYPYSLAELVETQGGGFSHVEPIEPWTMLPMEDEYGEVIAWEQEISADFGAETQPFQPDEIASFVLNKSCGRDKTGVSEVLRAEHEIETYRQNSHAITNAIEFAAWPRRLFKVGREEGGIIDDSELRRVRNRVDNLDEDTTLVTGPHIEHEMLEAQNFEFEKVTEHDLRKLALALGLPLELANVGSDGLGSGMPADLRLTLFERQARAAQRALADQFIQQVVRPVLDEYSPYSPDVNVELNFGDPISERDETANLVQAVGDWMTPDEVREMFDLPPVEDLDDPDFGPPGQDEQPMEPGGGGGGGGFFSDPRSLQSVPDNAVSISDRSEAPDDANIITGPGGGLYYVPSGEGGGGDRDGPPPSVDLSQEVDSMSLDEAGITDGSNHAGMRIAQLEDGGEVFVEEDYDDGIAEAEMAGVAVYEALDLPIPEHHYYEDDNEMAKEGIQGQTLRDAARDGGFDAEVDEESVIDAYAASLITGDTDMHGGNMMIREDGTAVPVDVEGSGGPVRDKSDQASKIQSMLDTAEIDVEYDDIWDRAQELADEIDPDAIPEGDEPLGEIASENIRGNIEAIAA